VGEILARWFEHQVPRCKPRSVDLYKIVRKRFSMLWGNLRPEELTTAVVEDTQETLLQVRLAPRSINHQIGIALQAIRWAADRGLSDTEPPKWKRLKDPNSTTHARKYLSASEVAKLLAAVREPKWQRLEVVVRLALYAGLRQQEIVWLTWDDVDLAEGWLHVRPKRGWSPKSRTSARSIPLAPELQDFLESVPRNGDRWVAPQSRGTQWCRRNLAVHCRRLFREAGVDDPDSRHTLHRLRGTFATTILRGGGDLESLREVLGHSTLSVTAGYLSATSESKRRAVQSLRFSSK
jgi:site-specific recombinase XerD